MPLHSDYYFPQLINIKIIGKRLRSERKKMARLVAIFLLICSMTSLVMPYVYGMDQSPGTDQSPEQVDKWFENLNHAQHKVTKLHFYFHDLYYNLLNAKDKATAVEVAKAAITNSSPTFFGSFVIADNPMTVGPEQDSKLVGRAQGTYAYASIGEFGLSMAFNFVFVSGPHKGSTLSLVGWNPVMRLYREMSIVGGSGKFRLARGVATAKTHFYDAPGGNTTLEWNIVVLHY